MTLDTEIITQSIYSILGVTNPRIKRSNKVNIPIPKHIRLKLKKYQDESGAMSWGHCLLMMITEIDLNRQMLLKLNIAIYKSVEGNNVNYFLKEFLDHATEQEKSYYEALYNGLKKNDNTTEG